MTAALTPTLSIPQRKALIVTEEGHQTMTDDIYICRTYTGKIHRTNSPAITFCNFNGQRMSGANRRLSDAEINKAPASAFCKKCFWAGKPELTCEVAA